MQIPLVVGANGHPWIQMQSLLQVPRRLPKDWRRGAEGRNYVGNPMNVQTINISNYNLLWMLMKILHNLRVVFIVEEVIWFDWSLKIYIFSWLLHKHAFWPVIFQMFVRQRKSNKDTPLKNVDKYGKCVVMSANNKSVIMV